MNPAALRIGQGFDTHRFGAGDHIMLGGERIAHDHGVVAHSDGDVIIHALIDALLGAAGLGDIGGLFPDTAARWENAAGLDLLDDAMSQMRDAGWQVVNADCTVLAERPKIAPHVSAIRANLSKPLGVDETAVNIKATSAEKMGFIGHEEGIAALAVALLSHS